LSFYLFFCAANISIFIQSVKPAIPIAKHNILTSTTQHAHLFHFIHIFLLLLQYEISLIIVFNEKGAHLRPQQQLK